MVCSFRDLVKKLELFWQQKGCIWLMPWDTVVGAATYHPRCFFEALTESDNKYMYINACRRLADGRCGQSSQRLLKHHQFQVILKNTNNAKDLYMESLTYLGIDQNKHDIKFIANDWNTASLGAFGRGWEVWCDLMEITQFTFFQIIGDVNVPSVTVEFAYGIERLLVILNQKPINDCLWDSSMTYGEVRQQEEIELSGLYKTYILYTKDDFNKSMEIVSALLQDRSFYGAYCQLLHSIYIFNCLEALKTVGPLEHKEFMDVMRSAANKIAINYNSTNLLS